MKKYIIGLVAVLLVGCNDSSLKSVYLTPKDFAIAEPLCKDHGGLREFAKQHGTVTTVYFVYCADGVYIQMKVDAK